MLIGDRVVNDLPPADRNVAMVFQNYALYPHLTVFENIAFPLRARRTAARMSNAASATPPGGWSSRRCSTGGRPSSRADSSSASRWRAPSSGSRAST